MHSEFTRENYSKRHHFLPVFFLKGFTNTAGKFHVYDKVDDKILENQESKSKYFEKHLNNFKFEGKIQFTLEEPYFTPLDTELAPLFVKLRNNNTNEDNLSEIERYQVLYFLMNLFWRLPETDKKAVKLIEKEGLFNQHLIFEKDGKPLKDSDMSEVREVFLNSPQHIRFYKSSLSSLNGSLNEIMLLFEKWNPYTVIGLDEPLIIGDNPFIINNPNPSLDQTFNELIFPLAENRLLVLSNKAPSYIDSHLILQTNLCVLHQAQRYVSCSNKDYLEFLIEQFKEATAIGPEQINKIAIFGLLHHQARFNSHEEYLQDLRIRTTNRS